MTWNYRIIYHDKVKHPYFAVHEIYYDEKHRVEAWTDEPINVDGASEKETIKALRLMLKDATNQTVLKETVLERNLKRRKSRVEDEETFPLEDLLKELKAEASNKAIRNNKGRGAKRS